MAVLSISTFCSFIPASLNERPWVLVLGIAVIVGFLLVTIFRYTSDQKAIRGAKNKLKAHLLAVRLFQDQLSVVLRSYGRILLGTGTYLRHASRSFVILIIPILFLIVQLDRYLGWTPIRPQQSFLLGVQTDEGERLGGIQLQLPAGLVSTAPAVHIPKENQAVWRIQASRAGKYDIGIVTEGQTESKQVVVSDEISGLSPVRLRGNWERIVSSNEAALSPSSHIQSISINYPTRDVRFAGWRWNWIVLFLVFSLAAGFIFKTVFRIQI